MELWYYRSPFTGDKSKNFKIILCHSKRSISKTPYGLRLKLLQNINIRKGYYYLEFHIHCLCRTVCAGRQRHFQVFDPLRLTSKRNAQKKSLKCSHAHSKRFLRDSGQTDMNSRPRQRDSQRPLFDQKVVAENRSAATGLVLTKRVPEEVTPNWTVIL